MQDTLDATLIRLRHASPDERDILISLAIELHNALRADRPSIQGWAVA